jgi:hypothetical protein
MDAKNKFTAETVQQLQQSLSDVPPYKPTELSKQQTLRTLSPQIFALRSKGYSWTAVAALLSERGLVVSVAALRTHLRRAREEAASHKAPTPAKRSRDVRADTHPPLLRPPIAPASAPSDETPPATKLPLPSAPTASTAAGQQAATPGPRREQEPRRGTFAVRSDAKDI